MSSAENLNRRAFMAASALGLSASAMIGAAPQKAVGPRRPVVVASANGMKTVEKAMEVTSGAALYRNVGLERLFRDVQGARYHPLQ